MPSTEVLFSFFLASMIIACVPGPSMFYAAAQTMSLGRRAGRWSALGFHIAGLCHVAAAAIGASTLLHAAPSAFMVMQFLGASYLIWMGFGYLRASTEPLEASSKEGNRWNSKKAFLDSVIVEILNPKSFVFFFLFLPQFTEPSATFPVWLQIAVLGTIVNFMFTLTDLLLIEASHAMVRLLKHSNRGALVIQRVGGVILIALGITLALDSP